MTPLPECCQAADNAPEFCPNHRPDVPPERSCERCNPPLTPHEWVSTSDGIRYWCPGYRHD